MHLIYGNIWNMIGKCDAICITTNGIIRADGEAVMGRGIALQAKQKYPLLPLHLANHLIKNGNHVGELNIIESSPLNTQLISFPTKHDWRHKSDIKLIEQSAIELVLLADKYKWNSVVLPKPGCSNGQLNWADVKKVIEKHFDDRFYIIDIK